MPLKPNLNTIFTQINLLDLFAEEVEQLDSSARQYVVNLILRVVLENCTPFEIKELKNKILTNPDFASRFILKRASLHRQAIVRELGQKLTTLGKRS